MQEEVLYLRYLDLQRSHEFLTERVNQLEKFIKDQYPQFFAGEAETVVDPELNAVTLHLGPMVPSLRGEESDATG